MLPIKGLLKTLPSCGINNYIKIQKQHSRKTTMKELDYKVVKDKLVLNKMFLQSCVCRTQPFA